MDSNQLPFADNSSLTGEGESFPIPLADKGYTLYFRTMEHVVVPRELQPQLAYELSQLFAAETFAQSVDGNVETGVVEVSNEKKEYVFELVMHLVENGREDYYCIDSIREIL